MGCFLIDPFQLATNGLGPGWSTFNAATSGFGFDIEVIIQPKPDTGGGWLPGSEFPDYHDIIVRIKFKGKSWEQRKTVSSLTAKSLERVLASFKYMNKTLVEITATINTFIKRTVTVFSRKK